MWDPTAADQTHTPAATHTQSAGVGGSGSEITQSQGQQHVCHICGYRAKAPSHLQIHFRIHSGEKPFKCPYCTYSSAQSNNLKGHIKRQHLQIEASNMLYPQLSMGVSTGDPGSSSGTQPHLASATDSTIMTSFMPQFPLFLQQPQMEPSAQSPIQSPTQQSASQPSSPQQHHEQQKQEQSPISSPNTEEKSEENESKYIQL
ncbi:unnamed protein product [Meganyctiphanes norvegica]|uniref:C2H2-type domain-containing protein n=1 Tax=Meganyctiphanes norvegica TaxID=48144 RepID=A0AAV2RDX5_MEGNR